MSNKNQKFSHNSITLYKNQHRNYNNCKLKKKLENTQHFVKKCKSKYKMILKKFSKKLCLLLKIKFQFQLILIRRKAQNNHMILIMIKWWRKHTKWYQIGKIIRSERKCNLKQKVLKKKYGMENFVIPVRTPNFGEI